MQWVRTTGLWSPFWLNDAPMSRRPWLHRPRHAEIDDVLREQGEHTHFAERRHPEDFSGRWMGSLRGLWGVPLRNPSFVGRDAELKQLARALGSGGGGGSTAGGASGSGSGSTTTAGVSTLELVGMGGVGKSQLATEYCYRSWAAASPQLESAAPAARQYALIVWLRAESAESLAADLRSLAIDSGSMPSTTRPTST